VVVVEVASFVVLDDEAEEAMVIMVVFAVLAPELAELTVSAEEETALSLSEDISVALFALVTPVP